MAGRHQQGVGIAGCAVAIYVGNGDNYYLTDSVYFAQERLEERINGVTDSGTNCASQEMSLVRAVLR